MREDVQAVMDVIGDVRTDAIGRWSEDLDIIVDLFQRNAALSHGRLNRLS